VAKDHADQDKVVEAVVHKVEVARDKTASQELEMDASPNDGTTSFDVDLTRHQPSPTDSIQKPKDKKSQKLLMKM
jgi:hypothetical protein